MGDYKEQIDELRAVERSDNFEYPIQVALVGTGVTLTWLLVGHWQFVAWFVFVYGLSTIERCLHRRDPHPYSRRVYLSYIALGTAIACSATFLPVYLWTFDHHIYHFAALVYTVGAVLNTFVVRSRAWPALLCYAIPNGLGMVCVAFMFTMEDGLVATSIVGLMVATWITIYLVVMVRESVRRVRRERETTRELLQAQKAETLANFAGGVAHDFNNLLGVIYASLEQARLEADDGTRRDLLDQGLVAVERSAGLTRQLLAVGRQTKFVEESIDLPAFMDELEQFLQRIIPTSVQVRVHRDPTLTSIESEPNLLQSMLLNLAMNARDAMAGGGELDICVERAAVDHARNLSAGRLEPGTYARFSVRDNGKGIPSEVFGRVLEPFFSTRPVGEGTGLGLAMVAGFVQQVGGALDIASTHGEGTHVTFYLPISGRLPRASRPTDQLPESSPRPALPATAGLTQVLLVEDQSALKHLLREHLTTKGYEVRACANGDAAWDAVEAGYEPHIVLTDVVMSGTMQGTELVARLRERLPSARLIMMSGYSFNEELTSPASGAGASANAILRKPFRLAELDKLIDGAIPPRRSLT